MREAIHTFIQTELLMGQNVALMDGDELLLSGLVDSLGAVRLIAHIEEQLGVRIPPEDVVIENFQSVDAIVAYLAPRQTA